MNRVKKTLIIAVVIVMLHCQIPFGVAAQTGSLVGPGVSSGVSSGGSSRIGSGVGSLVNPMEVITDNEPQIICSEEVTISEQPDGSKLLGVGKRIWLAVGVSLIAAIIFGVTNAGDNGGKGSGPVNQASDTGQISFDW